LKGAAYTGKLKGGKKKKIKGVRAPAPPARCPNSMRNHCYKREKHFGKVFNPWLEYVNEAYRVLKSIDLAAKLKDAMRSASLVYNIIPAEELIITWRNGPSEGRAGRAGG
jgi:hypothetical protein